MNKFVLLLMIIISSCAISKKNSHLTPLKELTFSREEARDPLSVSPIPNDYFEKNEQYILDLYFLIANDALYSGCLEIAHNGFVFLYQNDHRPGNREYLTKKFELLRDILRFKALYFKQKEATPAEFNKLLGLSDNCNELKESLE